MTTSSDEAPLLDGSAPDRKKVVFWKILSAVLYGVASFMITVINKTVLTTYSYCPQYLRNAHDLINLFLQFPICAVLGSRPDGSHSFVPLCCKENAHRFVS
jgi:hypothetical protein